MAANPQDLSPEYMAETNAPTIRAALWTASLVPLVLVSLRVYTRLHMRGLFGWDDGFIVASMVVMLAYVAVVEAALTQGLGRHVEYVAVVEAALTQGLGRHVEYVIQDPAKTVLVGLLGQVCQPFVIMSCALGKTSFAITMLRVAAQRWIHYTLWFLIITMNALHVTICIVLFARCEDPRHLWNPAIPSKCMSPNSFLYIMLLIDYSAATDFILALIPWGMLWGLQMRNREKIGVAVAMSLGIFAGSVAIIKATHLQANTADTDPTYSVGELLWWAGTENGVIIFAACIPTLRPLLRKIFPTSSAKRSDEGSGGHRLRTIGQISVVPKHKQGHWSAIAEAETVKDRISSDDQSDRSILKQHQMEGAGATRLSGFNQTGGGDAVDPHSPGFIKMTRQVDISYGQKPGTPTSTL